MISNDGFYSEKKYYNFSQERLYTSIPLPINTGSETTFRVIDLKDAILDEAIDYSCQFLSPNLKKENHIDEVENVTVQILAHLQSITDRIRRVEIEKATQSSEKLDSFKEENFEESYHQTEQNLSHRFRPFRKPTNFFGRERAERNVEMNHILSNILSIVAYVLFGYNTHQSSDMLTDQEIYENLEDDYVIWKDIKRHYSLEFDKKMHNAFNQANSILQSKAKYAKEVLYQRLTLFTFITVAASAKFMNKPTLAILSTLATTITIIFMFIQYGKAKFNQSKLESDLKFDIENAEKEAARCRF